MKYIFYILLMFFPYNIYALDIGDISPPEGVYNKNITLSVKHDNDIYFIYKDSISKNPVLYNQNKNPVILSAVEGEEKNYSITFSDNINSPVTLNYTIDRKKPSEPDYTIENNLFFFKKSRSDILYRTEDISWKKWNSEKIKLDNINTVFFYSLDPAGNKSRIKTWSYQESGNPSFSEKKIKILSPVEGSYYNRQLLYIDNSGYEWIRYSFKDSESALNGNIYTEPFIIDKKGDITLFTAAKPFMSGSIDFSEIKYTVKDDNIPIKSELLLKDSSKYLTAFSSKIILYSINSKTSFSRYEAPVKLVSEDNSYNFNTVYFKNYDDKSDYCYRYFYSFDNRKNIKTKPESVKNIIKNQSLEKPRLSGIKTVNNGGKQILLSQKDNISFLYTVSENDIPENPDLSSASSDTVPVLENPYGRDSYYYVKISAVDKYGNTSEPLEINKLTVDHYPPEAPSAEISDNLLKFNSSEDVYYRILKISDPAKETKWIKYLNPVIIRSMPGIKEEAHIEYYSSDRSGNKSIIQKKIFNTDNAYPHIAETDQLKKNNLLNTDFTLKKSMFSSDYDIFYTVSDNLNPPPDPSERSPKLKDDLVLSCPEGKEKYYTLKILPVSSINSNKGEISTFNIRIDKIPPPLPDLSVIREVYYSDNAVINPEGAGIGNSIFYSYSFDNNILKSPFSSIKAVNNNIIIHLPEKERKTCYLKAGTIDSAGNRSIDENIYSFIIDNRNYPDANPGNLKESTVTNKTVTVRKPDDGFIYRYEISNIQENLKKVTWESDIMDKDISFSSSENEEKSFYLAVKAFFDSSDKKGSPRKLYFIKTDRKNPEKPLITISDSNVISITGENRVFYSAFPEKVKNTARNFSEYKKPFRLNRYIPPGRYNIHAYSKDLSGNISPVAEDSFYISKNAVYVSEKSGNDKNTGTEITSPFKTAEKAFDYFINSNSDTVFFMEGNYSISESLNIDKPLFIKGIPGKTYIYDKTGNISSSFHVSDSSFILKDLIFISENYKNNYFYSDNALIVLDNSSFNVSCGNFITQDSGNLIIGESDISVYTSFNSEPFSFKNSIFTISGSRMSFSSAVNLKGFSTESCTGIIRNTSFSLKCSDLIFYTALNSILKTENIRVNSVSVNKSAILKAADSRIRLNNSFFSNAEGAYISDFIISENSEINVTGTSVNLNSRGKSALFNLAEGNCSLKKSLFIINNSTNHIPALKSDNSMFYIEDCDFTLENSIKGGFIKSADSIFELYSSAVTDLSDKNLFLMDYSGKGSVIIKNSLFNRDENILTSETGISVLKE